MADKHLWLIRHAKASAYGRPDHGRELAYRGYRQCVEMGQLLSTVSGPPRVFLTSDARRTYTTAHVLNGFVGGEVVPVRDMYTYDVDVLVPVVATLIKEIDSDRLNSIAVVGHNSAISDLVSELTHDSSSASLPTLGMAELVFSGPWNDLWKRSPISLHRVETPSAKSK
ncbi:MAG: histidine phosphatase family protein [Gammaproteobacteria bacterium]|nr:histidine phosphatase family protein [Gammaproteobacteria bacterium]